MGLRRTLRSFLRAESGAAFVEFAIGSPLLLIVAFGVAEVGRAITYHHAMEKSLRAATRYLARLPEDGIATWGLDRARNLALYGNLTGTGSPILSDWTNKSSVALSPAAGPYDTVTLTATQSYTFDMLAILGIETGMTFTVSHEERFIGG